MAYGRYGHNDYCDKSVSIGLNFLSNGSKFKTMQQPIQIQYIWIMQYDYMVLLFFLTLSTMGKNFSRQQFAIFFSDFSRKIGIDMQIIGNNLHKMSKPFSGKNIPNLSSAEFAHREVKVTLSDMHFQYMFNSLQAG